MFDRHAGYCAVWDVQRNRPLKDRQPRIWPNGQRMCDEAEWLAGYDDGVEACTAYEAGRAAFEDGQLIESCQIAANLKSCWQAGWRDAKKHQISKALRKVLKAAGPLNKTAIITSYPDRDDISGRDYQGGIRHQPLMKSDLLGECLNFFLSRQGRNAELPTTVDDMIEIYVEQSETEWGRVGVVSNAEARKIKAEEEYRRMEEKARRFADSCGQPLGTASFIKALRRALYGVRCERDAWNSGERRMEEWAACRYAGVSSEVYFDDLNFENGRYESRADDLYEIWAYLERKFPLLMLRYKEAVLRRKQKISQEQQA